MEVFVQQLINGLTLGSIYGLIAIGYTMVFGIIGMVNFAHGDVFMVSAFIALVVFLIVTTWLGIGSVVLALVIMLIVAHGADVAGELGDRARRLSAAARIVPAGAADLRDRHVDLPVELRAGRAGPAQQADPADVQRGDRADHQGDGYPGRDVATSRSSSGWSPRLLLAVFWFVVQKTPLGRAQRACEQDRKMAALVGINVDRTISLTFVIGAALAAVAGTMYLMYYGVVNFNDGFAPGVKAFTAAVLGGIGSLPGAVLGGILIGLIETLWSAYFSIDYKDVAAFSILAIVLIFLPPGLLGRPEVEKV